MAKNASGADEDVAKELKDMIGVLRRRKLFFAIGMNGRTPVIKTHMKQKPKKLRKDAKSAGAGPKGCSGEIALNGKVLELYCVEEGVPDAIAKMTTKFLRENGLQFRVQVMPGVIEEPAEDGAEEEEEQPQTARGRGGEAEEAGGGSAGGRGAAAAEEQESAAEEVVEELREANIETGPETGGGGAGAEAGAGAGEEVPAGRTAEQDQLLAGLRDMKSLLQQVGQQGRPDDVARMQKFGELFKKAVKQNDARVGNKVLDGMRQLAKQVEVQGKATQKRRKSRVENLKRMRSGLQSLIQELS